MDAGRSGLELFQLPLGYISTTDFVRQRFTVPLMILILKPFSKLNSKFTKVLDVVSALVFFLNFILCQFQSSTS